MYLPMFPFSLKIVILVLFTYFYICFAFTLSPLSTVCILHLQKCCEACQSLNEKAMTLAFYTYSSLGKLETPVYFNHT